MASSLPLPKGFFDAHRTQLSEDMRRQYIEYAEASIRKVFALSDCHKNSWIPMREKKGVAVYRNFGATRGAKAYKSNTAEVAGKGELAGSLVEVGRAYAAHDDAMFRRLMKKINPGVLDAAVLFTVVPRTSATPFRYIGVKWFAVKTPTPLVAHRDYCCLEVQDKIVDSFGNEMYIRILNSIDVNECPSLENSHGLVRAKLLSGFMYRSDRAEPGLVRVHHVQRFDPCGYFPSQWAFKIAESQLVNSIIQVRRVIDKQQMTGCTFVDKKQWVPNDQRQHCAVCARAFGTFRPRHHCRACGEVICGKCSVFKRVEVPGTTLKNVRICSICNMGVQHGGGSRRRGTRNAAQRNGNDDPEGGISDNMSDISTSSFTSTSTIAQNEMNMMDLYMTGGPSTPSAYSDVSTSSNLSMRSTTSTRSTYDVRNRGTSGNQSAVPPYSRGFGAGANRTPQSFFPESSNTPRSYIANNLTPQSGKGFGSGPVTPSSDASSTTPSHRMDAVKQAPLDLGYLRDTVKIDHDREANASGDKMVIYESMASDDKVLVAEQAQLPKVQMPKELQRQDGEEQQQQEDQELQPLSTDATDDANKQETDDMLELKAEHPALESSESARSSSSKKNDSNESHHQSSQKPRPSDSSLSSHRSSVAFVRKSLSRDEVGRSSTSSSTRKSIFGGIFGRSRSGSAEIVRSTAA